MDLNTPRMSRAAAKERTRALLVESGRRVFTERGFAGASVEEIATGAGFTRGAFYANFADKSELLWLIVEEDNEASFQRLVTTLADVPLEQKVSALQGWFESGLRRPLDRAFAELFHLASQSQEGRKRIAAVYALERRAICTILAAIEEAVGTPLPIPAEHFAAMGFALGFGLAQQHVVDPTAVPSTLFSDAQAYLWFGVLAAATSPEFTRKTGDGAAG